MLYMALYVGQYATIVSAYLSILGAEMSMNENHSAMTWVAYY